MSPVPSIQMMRSRPKGNEQVRRDVGLKVRKIEAKCEKIQCFLSSLNVTVSGLLCLCYGYWVLNGCRSEILYYMT